MLCRRLTRANSLTAALRQIHSAGPSAAAAQSGGGGGQSSGGGGDGISMGKMAVYGGCAALGLLVVREFIRPIEHGDYGKELSHAGSAAAQAAAKGGVISQPKEEKGGLLGSLFSSSSKAPPSKPPPPKLPAEVPYLIIGAGTAAFSAFRAIKGADADARVLMLTEEDHLPYMRPPLSKDMWFTGDPNIATTLKFKNWSGKERSVYFEEDEFFLPIAELDKAEHGGVAVAKNIKVASLDPAAHVAVTTDGQAVKYGKCLVATGGRPRSLPLLDTDELRSRTTLFRGIGDFQRLDAVARKAKSIAIVGGGFLGSELACALGRRSDGGSKFKVAQVFPEAGNMGRVLPEYLSQWTTAKVAAEGVEVLASAELASARLDGGEVVLGMSDGRSVRAEHVVVAVGLDPNTEIAAASGLEVDPAQGGFLTDAELRARSDVWVAGDCSSFYDPSLGRRRVEHHDHAVVSGKLAGENMTGAGKAYTHQSMFWSDLGPEVGYEAIGLVDARLPTVGVFAKATVMDSPQAVVAATGESMRSETESHPQFSSAQAHAPLPGEDYGKGVIFYTKGRKVVGMVLWNCFNRMPIARKILKEGKDHESFEELGKLFAINRNLDEEEEEKK